MKVQTSSKFHTYLWKNLYNNNLKINLQSVIISVLSKVEHRNKDNGKRRLKKEFTTCGDNNFKQGAPKHHQETLHVVTTISSKEPPSIIKKHYM